MMDGRFDHYFLELYAKSEEATHRDEVPRAWPLVLFALVAALAAAPFLVSLA